MLKLVVFAVGITRHSITHGRNSFTNVQFNFSNTDWLSNLCDFHASVCVMLLPMLLQLVKGCARAWGIAAHTDNKVHLYCLAFTYAPQVSLSLVCTAERGNLWLLQTCFFAIDLHHFLSARRTDGGNGFGYGLVEQTRDPWGIQSVCHHNRSIWHLSPASSLHTHRNNYLKVFSNLSKHCKGNTLNWLPVRVKNQRDD